MLETPKATHYLSGENVSDATMGNQQGTFNVSEAELGWTAGIIDGEGSVILFLGVRAGNKINNVSPQVIVANTDFAMMDRYVDILGRLGVGVHVSIREPRGPTGIVAAQAPKSRYKTLKVASTAGFKRTQKLLRVIAPYLVTEKRKKSELLLELIDRRLARCVENGKYSNTRYDHGDLEIMWRICQMMRSKHAHLIEGLLRDYEQSPRIAA